MMARGTIFLFFIFIFHRCFLKIPDDTTEQLKLRTTLVTNSPGDLGLPWFYY